VNSAGNTLKLKGKFDNGEMITRGKLEDHLTGSLSHNQIKWLESTEVSVTNL
jgi:hypothetical protein